ncbi:myelin protein zero-like 1 like [Lampris incognitus]|uniref:myelin protein zero-like 1 like n=1 Tax=Lampris incognitus TaxID=2546036 RepID=UPI0024B5CFCB|nr:myelin protein zero-like 1 like [Lampris incognitus]
MESKLLNTTCICALVCGFVLCIVFGTTPTSAIEIYTVAEVVFENGTTGILKCSFKSQDVVSSGAIVTWTFQPAGSLELPHLIFFFNGKEFPTPEYRERLQFIGDLNKKDASIQLSKIQFSDNGTYYCDVKNPPDFVVIPSRTVLRVVPKGSLPQSNTTAIAIAVCSAVILLLLIAIGTCVIIKQNHTRQECEGCMSMESVSSHASQPQKKVERSLEGSKRSSSSGPAQGPVIYAQLDHSGRTNPTAFHKMEPVVYADIRKN